MVLGVAFEKLFSELYKTVKDVVIKNLEFDAILDRLKSTLAVLKPLIREIQRENRELDRPEEEIPTGLIEKMKKGASQVKEYSKLPRWKFISRFMYANELFVVGLPARFLDTKVDFIIGFEVPLKELKLHLLKKELNMLVVTAPPGCGKTTLVTMLCHDEQIKEYLLEKFIKISKMPNCKILVTSRTTFTRFDFTYKLKKLSPEDAMKLFRHSANLTENRSQNPKKVIKKIVKSCGGFPWALEVVGRSLRRRSASVWLSRETKWSSDPINGSKKECLFVCLGQSLDFKDNEIIIQKCFMDHGLFPEDQKRLAATLIDMWLELYDLGLDVRAIKTPDDIAIWNLVCTALSELPQSIRSHHNLNLLDISACLSIIKLPEHIGKLRNWKAFHMKGA
ncbi:probable disease resistance protein At5g66900 [Juglans regia]|uniref:Probable disease resistance protein At5g66900 n=1 Tax=Juglans regia TaxID=51240 RepID=A0A6P9EWZ5_JUGRE|nr:probable disease resistance protein At5g66900 [Juglans regia]